eukprot:6178744-Pleurochrysis_carterae.AAC.3
MFRCARSQGRGKGDLAGRSHAPSARNALTDWPTSAAAGKALSRPCNQLVARRHSWAFVP